MKTLGVALDSVASLVGFVESTDTATAPASTYRLSSRALLINNGWMFAEVDKWAELEEIGASLPSKVVSFKEAMSRPGTLHEEKPAASARTGDGLPTFNRIDYLASLFGAAAELACPRERREDLTLAVAVPAYAFAADRACLTEIRVPNMLAASGWITDGELRGVRLRQSDVILDIRRSALRAGFPSVAVDLGALSIARHYLAADPGSRNALSADNDGYVKRGCAVEFADFGLTFVPFEVNANGIVEQGQCLFAPVGWEGDLRRAIETAMESEPAQRDTIWRRVGLALDTASALSIGVGDVRIDTKGDDYDAKWQEVITGLETTLASQGVRPSAVVRLLTESNEANKVITRYVLAGFGIGIPALRKLLEDRFGGDPVRAHGQGNELAALGILDHIPGSIRHSPRFPQTAFCVDAALRGLFVDKQALDRLLQDTPDHGAGIYARLTATAGDAAAQVIDLTLPTTPRPILKRVIVEDGKIPRFTISLESADGTSTKYQYEISLELQPWELSKRLEIELKVDDTDRVEIRTLVGGALSPAAVTRVGGGDGVDGLGLGHFALYADVAHRSLTDAMSRDGSRPASNSRLYRPVHS